jgi:hypothetical protein
MPKIYNRLENPELQFGILHRVGREYCERVNGGKKFKEDSLTGIAGNGQFGFQSSRRKREVASMTETVDGTGLKKAKKSACRPRKMVCRLVSSAEIHRHTMDQEILAQRAAEQKKMNRRNRRNPGARQGRKQPVLITLDRQARSGRRGGLEPTCKMI